MRRLALTFLTAVVVVGASGIEAKSSPYTQEVDNATEGRFEVADGWGAGTYGKGVYDENYRFARPSKEPNFARFKVDIPETANYAVYARWPEVKGLNDEAPVGVETTSGVEWTKVNQRENGGRWVRIGVYEMAEGDDYSVEFSRRTNGEGYIAADAVKVERVAPAVAKEPTEETASPKGSTEETTSPKENPEKKGGSSSSTSGRGSERATSSTDKEARAVLAEARDWIGVRYRLGRTSRSGVDCSGFTMQVFKKSGIELPHDVVKQYKYGSRVTGSPEPGDLVFFDEHGDGISHVGIYSGNGKLIHASDYFNKVVESDMKYVKGYKGARRLL